MRTGVPPICGKGNRTAPFEGPGRPQGDGSRLLLLEIDPPQDEVSRRRERFYLSNGMCPNYDYDHVHPSFRPTTDPHRLFLMSYPRPLTEAEFRAFQQFNNERVLSYSERK